jgi:proline iminopeptidase
MVLRATFLGTSAELQWAFDNGLAAFHPDLHAQLKSLAPDGLETLWPLVLDPDPAIHAPAARAFSNAERAMSELIPPQTRSDGPLSATAFMEAHYFLNDCFLEPDALLHGAAHLGDIPGIVVQARLDLLCPPKTAARLVNVWPGAQLRMVEAAGHSLGHPAVFQAVRAAIDELTQ